MSKDTELAPIYFDLPRDGSPDFVLGQISIKPEALIAWLNQVESNEKGYVRLDVLKAKQTGKPYVKMNTWKPTGQKQVNTASDSTGSNGLEDQEIPF